MHKKSKVLLQNVGLFTIGSFGSKILAFILVPLYTVVLSTEEYGSVDLIVSTSALLMPILLLSIFDATLRFSMDSAYKKKDVISTSINIAIKGSIILIVGVVFVKATNIINVPSEYLIFLVAYFMLDAVSQIFNIYLKARNQAAVIAASGVLCTLVMCSSNILLLLVFKWGIVGYMVSNTLGIFVQNLYQLIRGKIYRDIYFKEYNNLFKPMVKYSLPLIANTISWWINNTSDRYIITFMRGISENGIYSVSYKIPTILSMFQGIFYNAWSISAIAEFDENDSDGFIGKNYSMYSFISLLVCSGLLIFNMPLAKLLYKNNYFAAWKCVPFLLVGTVFSGISQFEGALFAATRNTKIVARTTTIGAVINTLFNFVFIYVIGTVGAAFATFVGYFITWRLRTKHLNDFVKMRVNWRKHYFSIAIVVIQSVFATVGISPMFQVGLLLFLVALNVKLISPILKNMFKRER